MQTAMFPKALPLPYGWFRAVDSSALAVGDVQPVLALDQHLVAWRDQLGQANVSSAFCPHLGAHLGYGGTVEDTTIRCPFHGWTFDSAGRNTSIPYSPEPNRAACLKSFPVVESGDMVLFWYHPDGSPPKWDVPIIDADRPPTSTPWRKKEWEYEVTWQDIAENGIDLAHLKVLHRMSEMPVLESYEADGPIAKIRTIQTLDAKAGFEKIRLDSDEYGPGFHVARIDGFFHADIVAALTPISPTRSRIAIQFSIVRQKHDHVTRMLEEFFFLELVRQFEQDAEIHVHKAYIPQPYLAKNDGPIMKFRKWAAQFYV